MDAYLKTLEEKQESLHLACDYEDITKPFIKEFELKFPQLFQPIRIALTGGTQAPSVYDIMAILGYNEVNLRIRTALDKNFNKEA